MQSEIAEISVSYHPAKTIKPPITCSREAYEIFAEVFPKDTIALCETFMVMYLNRASKVLGVYKVSMGGITATVADPKLIIAVALKVAATSIMLAHNHPSGSIKPSRQDEELTSKIKEGAKWFDIRVLDHLILSPDVGQYYSFADEGVI